MAQSLLITMVSGSAFTDILKKRIYNVWLAICLLAGIAVAFATDPSSVKERFMAFLLILSVLIPVYMLGGIGAGDVKLLTVAAFFLGIQDAVLCTGLSFIVGFILSIPKCVMAKNIRQQIHFAVPVTVSVLIILIKTAAI